MYHFVSRHFHPLIPEMNNSTFNATSIAPDALIVQEVYIDYLYVLFSVSSLTLLVYTTVLDVSREGKYLWLSPKPFSITTVLYALMRHGTLISQILWFWTDFLPGGSVCNDLFNIGGTINLIANVGVQGILILRVYALCEGNRAIIGALILLMTGNTITNVWGAVISNGSSSNSNANSILNSVGNILLVLIELLVFSACIWKVWGTWRLKGETGIRNKNDLVSVILRQVLSQFFFVIFSCGGSAIVNLIELNDNVVFINNVVISLGILQQSLTTILIAHFVLDLRQRNSAIIRTTDVTLPTLQFRNVMDYMHQSIMVEMSDHENENAVVDVMEGDDNGDILPAGSPADIDVEIGCNKLESV